MNHEQICRILIEDPNEARFATRQLEKVLSRQPKNTSLKDLERVWKLRLMAQHLVPLMRKRSSHATDQRQPQTGDPFASSFSRLSAEDQLLLVLRTDSANSWNSLASIFQTPEGSLRLRYRQAVLTMAEAIWDPRPSCSKPIALTPWTLDETDSSPETAAHLKTCAACKLLKEHHQKIWDWIKTKESASLVDATPKSKFARTRHWWSVAPWFLRTSIEGAVVSLTIMLGVALVPKLRSVYEKTVANRLESFDFAEPSAAILSAGTPLSRDDEPSEDTAEEDVSPAFVGQTIDDTEVTVGENEVWRLNIKTESPRDMRSKIENLLKQIGISQDTAEARGVQAPGGSQYSLLFPKDKVIQFKNEIKKMSLEGSAAGLGETNFAWFKNKAKKKLAPDTTSVIVWVYQI